MLSRTTENKSSAAILKIHFRQKLSYNWLLIPAIIVLCGVHLLLPIERGLPTVKIVGYPVTCSILSIWFFFALILVSSGGKVLRLISSKYVISQLLVVSIFSISAVISEDIIAACFVTLNYFTLFVLGFLVILYSFKNGLRQQFGNILCCVAAIASLVGIVEGLFRFYIPIYKILFLNYQYHESMYAMSRADFRAFGTLGNPLIYAVAMILCIPFALDLKRPFYRYGLVLLLLAAIGFAVSTTALVFLCIILIGVYATSKKKTYLLVKLFVFSAVVLILLYGTSKSVGMVNLWKAEFDFVDSSNPQYLNIVIRYNLFKWAIDAFSKGDFPSLLFGYGLKSSITEVSKLGIGDINTLDNTFSALLFESGLMGLGAFLLMGVGILFRHRNGVKNSLHWYNVLGLVVAGFSFSTIFYSTFNLIWVASVATLAFKTGPEEIENKVAEINGELV